MCGTRNLVAAAGYIMDYHLVFQAWKTEAVRVGQATLGGCTAPLEIVLLVLSGYLVFTLTMAVTGKAQGLTHMTWNVATISSLVGIILAFLILIPIRLYLLPHFSDPRVRMWVLEGAFAAGVLVIILPVLTVLQGSGYVKSLISLALSAAAAGLAMVAVNGILNATFREKDELEKIRDRKENVQRMIQEQSRALDPRQDDGAYRVARGAGLNDSTRGGARGLNS
jgi:hypothetical protein